MLESTIHFFYVMILWLSKIQPGCDSYFRFSYQTKHHELNAHFLKTTSIRVRNTRTQGSFFISETKYVRRNVIVSFANFYNRLKKYLLLFQPCYKNFMAILCPMMIVCFRSLNKVVLWPAILKLPDVFVKDFFAQLYCI